MVYIPTPCEHMTEVNQHTTWLHNPTYYYMPLGYDCSPTMALKKLGLRKCSLPFDWVQSNHYIVMQCIDDEFRHFHKDVYLIKGQVKNGQRVIDHYGVEFPHDYPCAYDVSFNTPEAVANDDAFFTETVIIDTYKKYRNIVLQKYEKRIQRFYEILHDTSRPLIILMRELFSDVMLLKEYLENKFNRKNIMYVVATDETHIVNLPPMMTYFNPCVSGGGDDGGDEDSRDVSKWKDCIDTVKRKYEKMMRENSNPDASLITFHNNHVIKHRH